MVIGVGVRLFKKRRVWASAEKTLRKCGIKNVDPHFYTRTEYKVLYSLELSNFEQREIKKLCRMIMRHRNRSKRKVS